MGFSASRLSFELIGEGVAIDPATGLLSIPADGLGAGITVIVTATDAAGGTVGRYRLILSAPATETEAEAVAPALGTAPSLAGPAGTPEGTVAIGAPVTLDPGAWHGTPAPSLAVDWLLDGAVAADATGLSYVPQPADDGRALSARVTATNAAGSAAAETATCAIVHAVPTVVAPLADVAADAGAAPVAVEAAAAFAGAALTFAVNGTGATIDSATGVVTIATDQLLDGERITVTATNSGGSALASFLATVRATPPVCAEPPALAEAPEDKGVIGTPVTLDPGAWEGVPAPDLAIAWLLDGSVVEGATDTSYTPVAADDGKRLSARVTATNAAGEASAETAARAIVHAAPTVAAPLADLGLFLGDAPAVVEAAAAFEGHALVFAVEGGGATVDATGRVSVPATAAGSATVTVTATNSGGSAHVSFVATVSVRIVPPVLVLAPVLAGTGRIGEPVTVSGGNWSGVPAPSTSVAWLRDGTAIAGAAGTSYTPVAADDGKDLSARVTATNAGGSADMVTAALAITYAPPVAKGGLQEEIFDLGSGVETVAAGADFTGENLTFAVTGAGATIDARTGLVSIPTDKAVQATVTVTATNSGGSATSSFQVTVEAEDIPFALEAEDVEIVTAVWRPEAQETWFTPVVRFPGLAGETVDAIEWTTSSKDPIPETEYEVVTKVGTGYQLYMRTSAKNAPGASPRVDYSVFRDADGGRRDILRFRWRRTAEGPWSALSPAFSVPAPTVEDIPFALKAEDVEIVTAIWRPEAQGTWFTPVVRFPGLAGKTVDAIEWTTSTKDPIPETEYEVVTKAGSDRYQLYMRDAAKNAPDASPRVDYSVFKLDEKRREVLRFRWRHTAEGPWSAMSPAFSVPAVPAPAAGWLPMVARTPQEHAAGKIGGSGYQVLRSYATTPANPDLIIASMDQNLPWISRDFGNSMTTPRLTGMLVGRSGVSVWIDPQDANRMLFLQSTAEYWSQTAYDAYSGLYLSTDGGQTVTHVQSMPLLLSTQNTRHNLHLIAHAPGGTPTTRTIYTMEVSRTGSPPSVGKIQLWRSQDGGATWHKRGGELSAATYASGVYGPYGLAVAPNGHLYMYGRRGAWRSTDGGLTWGSRLSTLPDAAVNQMDVAHGGGVIWATVANNGLYKATDGVTFSKVTAYGTKNATSIGISPADRNYMVVTAEITGQLAPSWSHDGGVTWTVGTTNKQLGQEENFEHSMGSSVSWIVPKVNDRDIWFAYRYMHLGISRDGGKTWNWTGNGFDGTHTRGMGFHPSNWKVFAQAQQDRGLVITNTAGDSWLPDLILKSNTYGTQITDAVGNNQYISGGSVIIHSSGRLVTLQGHVLDGRVPVIMEPSGGNPVGGILVKGAFLSGSLSEPYGSLDPYDGNTGFLGRYRVGSLNAGAMSGVTFTQLAHHFIGATGAGGSTVIYGADNSSTDRALYRSTDRGASWTLWRTATASFRPVDNRPRIAVCPHHAARIYAPSGSGVVVRIQGVTSPTETKIFDIRNYVGNNLPRNALFSVEVDPFNENLLYVSMSMWGSPNIFRSTDFGATWEDISAGVPQLDGILFIHPLTSDVFFGCSHGTHVLAPPAGHRTTYGITNSVYDQVRSFLASNQ